MMITYKHGCEAVDWAKLVALYREVGLVAGHGRAGNADAIEKSFRASFKVVTAWLNGELIGAARAMSDGICYSAIFDVGVLPGFQRRGVGKGLMKELSQGLEHTRIHLTSTFGNEAFYERLGFKRHKTAMAKYPVPSDYLEETEETRDA